MPRSIPSNRTSRRDESENGGGDWSDSCGRGSGYLALIEPEVTNQRANIYSIASSMRQYLSSWTNIHQVDLLAFVDLGTRTASRFHQNAVRVHLLRGIDLPDAHCT